MMPPRRMNRPASAPAKRGEQGLPSTEPVVGTGPRVVGHAVVSEGQRTSGALEQRSPRTEYRPRSSSRGTSKDRSSRRNKEDQRSSAAVARRREVVNEYMKAQVDPIMHELITALLTTQPNNVPHAMVRLLQNHRSKHPDEAIVAPVVGPPPHNHHHGTAPPKETTGARKVSRADRVYMVKRITPVIQELLADVVKARPANPCDFMIAWLSSKKTTAAAGLLDQPEEGAAAPPPPKEVEEKKTQQRPEMEAEAPKSVVRSKFDDAVSFDAHVQRSLARDDVAATANNQKDRPPSPTSVVTAAAEAPEEEEERIEVVATKKILVIGHTGSGKTTILRALGGDLEPKARPTTGFRTHEFPHADEHGEADGTTLCFYDVSGKPKARKMWFANFCEVHAVVFVIDCAAAGKEADGGGLDEAKAAFDATFRPSAADMAANPRRAMILGKPLLVVANKQDVNGAVTATALATALDLASLQDASGGDLDVALCAATGAPQHNLGKFDDRLEKGIDWLAGRVDEAADALEKRVRADTVRVAALDKQEQLDKEKRVFRKTMRKAHPRDGEAEETLGETEGLDFFASELGCEGVAALSEEARAVARLVNYQKLALQILGNMHNPINPKKRAPVDWPGILAYATDRKNEAWDPAFVKLDEEEDTGLLRNR